MTLSEPATHLDADDLTQALAADVRAGLGDRPRTLPPKYFYDAAGSALFDQITRLPEYYPTRAERQILERHAVEIATEVADVRTLVELGSGTSEKTRLLLTALREHAALDTFVPFDVDPAVLGEASTAIGQQFPGLAVQPVVGDFERHLRDLPGADPRMVAFLGSTIGNFEPAQRAAFLTSVRAVLGHADAFLLGVDLVKDADRLVRAYDDSQGVTAAFNRNVLAVINRQLDADFDPADFEHVARWDAGQEWIEMRLRARRAVRVRVAALDLDVDLDAGEEIRTEVSAKFRREGLAAELAAAGLRLDRWWTDDAGDFGLLLARPSNSDNSPLLPL